MGERNRSSGWSGRTVPEAEDEAAMVFGRFESSDGCAGDRDERERLLWEEMSGDGDSEELSVGEGGAALDFWQQRGSVTRSDGQVTRERAGHLCGGRGDGRTCIAGTGAEIGQREPADAAQESDGDGAVVRGEKLMFLETVGDDGKTARTVTGGDEAFVVEG